MVVLLLSLWMQERECVEMLDLEGEHYACEPPEEEALQRGAAVYLFRPHSEVGLAFNQAYFKWLRSAFFIISEFWHAVKSEILHPVYH